MSLALIADMLIFSLMLVVVVLWLGFGSKTRHKIGGRKEGEMDFVSADVRGRFLK